MSAMVFLPLTRRRDDERRAPFAQVRLAASVLVRVATRWSRKTLLHALRDTVNESQMQKDMPLRRTFNASSSFNTYP